MSSLFYGLEIARTGLTVSQKAINLSGHNIANANTEGYTRQRLVINSIQPASVNVRLSSISRGSVGGGATVALGSDPKRLSGPSVPQPEHPPWLLAG